MDRNFPQLSKRSSERVLVSSISFLHSRMTFSNTSFSRVNVCSGCPVIPVKAAVAASFFSLPMPQPLFSALAFFLTSLHRGTVPHGHHTISARSQVVCRPAEVPALRLHNLCRINLFKFFCEIRPYFFQFFPRRSAARDMFLICSTRVLCSMILSFPIYIDSLTNSFFILQLQYTQKWGKEYVVATTFYILFVVLYSFRKVCLTFYAK